MSYNYTNGDGVTVLLTSEPNGATEPISNLDNAIRQIKSFLNDPLKGIPYLEAAIVAAGSAGNRNFFSVYSSANQTVPVSTETKVVFGLEQADPDGVYTPASSRFTAPATGWYQFVLSIRTDWLAPSTPTNLNLNLRLKKNGTTNVSAQEFDLGSAFGGATYSLVRSIQLNATDYIEVYAYYTLGSGSVTFQITADNTKTSFQGIRML